MSVPHRLGPVSLIAALAIAALMLLGAEASRAGGIDGLSLDTLGGTQPQGKRIVVELEAGAAEVVSVAARGYVRQGGHRFYLHRATATVAPGRRASLELRPRKRWQERRISRALRNGRRLTAKVRVRYRDVFGNVARRTRRITLS